jgi:hypothetical protein
MASSLSGTAALFSIQFVPWANNACNVVVGRPHTMQATQNGKSRILAA